MPLDVTDVVRGRAGFLLYKHPFLDDAGRSPRAGRTGGVLPEGGRTGGSALLPFATTFYAAKGLSVSLLRLYKGGWRTV